MDEYELHNETLSVKEWLVTLLITAIPLVGLIMLFVWAFSDSTPVSKANWAKAALLMYAIIVALYFIAIIFVAGLAVTTSIFQ